MSERTLKSRKKKTSSLELASFDLLVTRGPDMGLRFPMSKGAARIGSAATNDVRLSDPTVSRLHCEITVGTKEVSIVDLGSTNGTIVNGVGIRDALLNVGATVTLGGTQLVVQRGTDPVHIPLSDKDHFGGVVGQTVEMRRVYETIEQVAPTDVTVLIEGETGTGKEVVARAIHDSSARASQPFVVVDCGAIAEHLIEAELFGYVRGAFTGAGDGRRGLFEEASGGTIFLDEIGELPLTMQPKLLRVLEMREVKRVGENTPRKIDVRVVAATNRSLASNVNDGTFRDDLYYRLAVVKLELPALRARKGDIPLLAAHFYSRATGGNGELPQEWIPTLMSRSWPGNVRELRNFVERAACLGVESEAFPSEPHGAIDLPEGVEALVPIGLPFKEARGAWINRFESIYVSTLLKKTSGNVTHAAELAGMHRRTLQRIMVSLGIRGVD